MTARNGFTGEHPRDCPSRPVLQFEQQRRFDSCILVDAFDLGDEDNGGESVETAISLAATLVVRMIGSPSNRVVLAVAGKSTDAVIGGGSRVGKRRMLEMLAQVEPSTEPLVHDALGKATEMVGRMQDLVVVSSRPHSLARLADPSIAAAIAPWVRRGVFRWIDTSDPRIDRWVVRESSETDVRATDRQDAGAGR